MLAMTVPMPLVYCKPHPRLPGRLCWAADLLSKPSGALTFSYRR